MSTKKTTNRPAPRKTKVQWKASKPAQKAVQGDLFEAPGANIEVTIRVPSGTPITIGRSKGDCQEISVVDALRKLANASKEDLRAAMSSARLQSQQIIGLCTVMHGNLYHLAAIGAKVSGKNR